MSQCSFHPDKEALGSCPYCGRAACFGCLKKDDGLITLACKECVKHPPRPYYGTLWFYAIVCAILFSFMMVMFAMVDIRAKHGYVSQLDALLPFVPGLMLFVWIVMFRRLRKIRITV